MSLSFAFLIADHPTDDKKSPIHKLHVNQANGLITAAQGLLLPEKRAISMCLAQLDSKKQENGRYKFVLHASDYATVFQLDLNTAYDQLRGVADHLMDRKSCIVTVKPDGKTIVEKLVWVSGAKYFSGEGKIEIGFSPEITPYLTALGERKGYTGYKLKATARLQSMYSWRLFELLMQKKGSGLLRISINDFCRCLEVPQKCETDFGQLRRIIERAVQELKEKNNIPLEWIATKRGGRKLTGLEFMFKKDPKVNECEPA